MKVVIQRVSQASVVIGQSERRAIGSGLLVYLGIGKGDNLEDCQWMARKIINLRLFPDGRQRMNRSLTDIQGEILVISQFTLHARTRKGYRPSFSDAESPEKAIPLYENFIAQLTNRTGKKIQTGEFGADMQVECVNTGPVTIILDSRTRT